MVRRVARIGGEAVTDAGLGAAIGGLVLFRLRKIVRAFGVTWASIAR